MGLAAHVVKHSNILRTGDFVIRAEGAVGVAVDYAQCLAERDIVAVAAVGDVGEGIIKSKMHRGRFKSFIA